jgi:hypothetical protein
MHRDRQLSADELRECYLLLKDSGFTCAHAFPQSAAQAPAPAPAPAAAAAADAKAPAPAAGAVVRKEPLSAHAEGVRAVAARKEALAARARSVELKVAGPIDCVQFVAMMTADPGNSKNGTGPRAPAVHWLTAFVLLCCTDAECNRCTRTAACSFADELSMWLTVRLGVPAASVRDQRRMIRRFVTDSNAAIKIGDEYFVVSMKWWAAWKAFSKFEHQPPNASTAAAAASSAPALITVSSGASSSSGSGGASGDTNPIAGMTPKHTGGGAASVPVTPERPAGSAPVSAANSPATVTPAASAAAAAGAAAGSPAVVPDAPRPGPIDNTDLLERGAEFESIGWLKRNLTLGRECVVLSEPAWTALVNW